jgi:hypothetical protein
VVINFVPVPTIVSFGADKRGWFLAAIFPPAFSAWHPFSRFPSYGADILSEKALRIK